MIGGRWVSEGLNDSEIDVGTPGGCDYYENDL